MQSDTSLPEALVAVVEVIDACGGRGVLIGGLALSFVARPRATRDIDALILASEDDVENVWKEAKIREFEISGEDALTNARITRFMRLRHKPTQVIVDFQIGLLPFDYEVVDRGLLRTHDDLHFRVATPEDLVILKAIAARPQDLVDIDNILTAVGDLDRDRIREKLTEFRDFVEAPERIDQVIGRLG